MQAFTRTPRRPKRLRRPLVAVTAMWLLGTGLASAQLGNPAGTTPGTQTRQGTPAPATHNPQDRLFVQLVGMGGLAEVEAGKMAGAQSRHPGVKAYARRMVDDHGATHNRLAAAARQSGIPVPQQLGPDEQASRERMQKADAASFDATYLQEQLIAHQKTVALLQWEMSNGQDAQLQKLASEALPTVLDHLQAVQGLLAEITGAPPQGLATMPASDTRGRR